MLDATVGATGLRRPEAQKLLGRFLFSGWEAHEKPVTALSGGERRRLALALVVASGANFLVLDEPTNHLDLESREALEAALAAFPGTVLLVTHDRALLDAVVGRLLAIEDRAPRLLPGRLGRVPAAAASPSRRRAEAAPKPPKREKPKPPRGRTGPDAARARRARDRAHRGADRRARAAARRGLDERRPRRRPPRGPGRPERAADALGALFERRAPEPSASGSSYPSANRTSKSVSDTAVTVVSQRRAVTLDGV